jgi:hypothetical protein
MNHLFMNAPLFVPAMKSEEFDMHDLEMRVAAETEKQAVSHAEETHKEKAT